MMDRNTLSDTQLIELLKEGDHRSFNEIYKRYNALLYSCAYNKVQDKEEAQDIVQDVYGYLWNCRETLNIQTTLAGYLYRAVLNKANNVFRHIKITRAHVASFKNTIESAADQTDYRIREKDIHQIIEKEIGRLPEKMREVFLLRTKEHLTNKDIAKKLNLSEETVKTQVKKALKVLKARLGLLIFLYALINGMLK